MSKSAKQQKNKVKILIAEDIPSQAEQLRRLLEANGFSVSSAGNGDEALTQLRAHPASLVISDIIMPKVDGFELCKRIKADEKLKDTPVVFLTALDDPGDVMRGLECGADNFITKPYIGENLLAHVQELLEKDDSNINHQEKEPIEVKFNGRTYLITADSSKIIKPLLSTYETVIQKNQELSGVRDELKKLNDQLEQKINIRTSALIREIDERKQAEEKLRTAEENFRNSIENSPLGIRIVTGDSELLYANKAILDIAGYDSFEEFKKVPISKLYTPESYAQIQQWQKAEKTGHQFLPNYEVSIIRKDGEIRHMNVFRKEVFWDGQPEFQVLYQDITEQKRAGELLEKSEQRLREAQSIGKLGNWEYDLVNKKMDWSDEVYEIYERERKLGPPSIEDEKKYYYSPEEAGRLKEFAIQALKTGQQVDYDFTPNLPSGKTLVLHTTLRPIKNAEGEITSLFGIVQDITERRQMQEKLILSDRLAAIGQLASGIAHELNNPLTGVIGFSELLLGKDVPQEIKEDLEVIHREAERTAKIVKGLLTFARQQKNEKELANINDIIQSVLQLRSYEQKVSNIEVETDFEANLPDIFGNIAQLQQVVVNIVINAEQAMLEKNNKGKIVIVTEKAGKMVRASFTDDGPGITPANMRRIFTPFFTTKEVGKGTGLGLSICMGIITEHGGKIYAESKPGNGATFTVELPVKTGTMEID